MKALSIRQPWAWAILHVGKDVENRDWKNAWAPSGEILLHAAKGSTSEEFREAARVIQQISGHRPPPLSELPRGGIVGAFRIVQAVRQNYPTSPWAVPGLVHLHLERVRELPFVELAGQLGFFEVPPSVVAHLFPPPAEQMGLFGGSRG